MERTKRMKLLNQTQNNAELARDLRVARTFWERSKGLLGRASLPQGEALWIQGTEFVGCNSIHTMFMRFAIDAVFVDRDLKVKKVYRELGPWKMTWPASGAHSVFEFPAGALKEAPVAVGDQLHVGD
jgi:uncharacterized membrane protein (UPF0127 family)